MGQTLQRIDPEGILVNRALHNKHATMARLAAGVVQLADLLDLRRAEVDGAMTGFVAQFDAYEKRLATIANETRALLPREEAPPAVEASGT